MVVMYFMHHNLYSIENDDNFVILIVVFLIAALVCGDYSDFLASFVNAWIQVNTRGTTVLSLLSNSSRFEFKV